MEICRGFRKGRTGSRVAFVPHALVCTLPSLILTSLYNLLLAANGFEIGCFRGLLSIKSHLLVHLKEKNPSFLGALLPVAQRGGKEGASDVQCPEEEGSFGQRNGETAASQSSEQPL